MRRTTILAVLLASGLLASAAVGAVRFPHHPECGKPRCVWEADRAFARKHRPPAPRGELTEASWFYDSGELACRPVQGAGVAHKTLPCGSPVHICKGSVCITAHVEDRGPYVPGRELDLDPESRDALGCFTCEVRWHPGA